MAFSNQQGNCGVFHGARVLITGHTGFKGSWLSLMLHDRGAEVFGIALPSEEPSFYNACHVDSFMKESRFIDIRDLELLKRAVKEIAPDVIFHLAAQSLVRTAIADPIGTLTTNVIGTANVLEAIRETQSVKASVITTSDKCYWPQPELLPYAENSPLGGHEPYAASKAAAELVVNGYRGAGLVKSPLATVRAGNVIGGGDWASDRLIPDCIRALQKGVAPRIRNPRYTRPWQHVIEPLSGYLMLAEKLLRDGNPWSGAWNFGPDGPAASVESVATLVCEVWGSSIRPDADGSGNVDETALLAIDPTKAKTQLGWIPRWDTRTSVTHTVEWYRALQKGQNVLELSRNQVEKYRNTQQ